MPDAHHLGCAGSGDLAHDTTATVEGREATLTLLEAALGVDRRRIGLVGSMWTVDKLF